MKDPYSILGVSHKASADEIKRAYRRLARERHPDLDRHNPWAEDEFKEISSAYDLLSDREKRSAYDRGEIDEQGNPVRRRGSGFWNSARSGFARNRQKRAWFEEEPPAEEAPRGPAGAGPGPGRIRGADVSYRVSVNLLESARGVSKRIETTRGRTLDVRIPAGAVDGQVLRLKGQGLPGLGGGDPGDALVTVTVREDSRYRVDGLNVHTEAAITLEEAVLGGRIEVDTVHGPVTVTVPENANTGTVLRLKGKGLNPAHKGAGDHFVRLSIMLPPYPDKELAEFIREWAKRNPYSVRH